jgi:hypothetical protein
MNAATLTQRQTSQIYSKRQRFQLPFDTLQNRTLAFTPAVLQLLVDSR